MLSGAAVAAMLLLTGCAKENGLNQWMSRNEGCTELELTDVNSGEMLSKAAIDGTGFPRDGRIGLFFFKDEAGAELYGDSSCSNVEYSYNQDKSKWTASPAIRVGSTPGYLYGYYPYNGADKDVKSIAVESSLDGDDAMYVAKQDPVTDQTAGNVAITMRHALARVSITVKNKGYSGAAKLSRIEFVGAKTAQSGTLNALDGSITATKSDVTLEVPEASQQITEAGTRYECLLVPSEVDVKAQNVTLRLTIDGQQKTVSLTGENAMKIVSGVKARLTIDLSDTGLSVVDGIQVDDWQTVTVGGYTVTVKFSEDAADVGIADNLYTQISVSNDIITIGAYSKEVKPLIIRIDDGTLIAPVESGNFSTFTISDITEDITATLAYAKTFKVTQSFKADVTPVSGYFENYPAQGLGEVLEGRTTTVTVPTNVPGYHFENIVCDEKIETGGTIVLKNVSKNFEVVANYKFYDYPLPGVFTVADDKAGNVRKVQFARGNLWYQNGVFHNENEQYAFSSSDWKEGGHISHFMWCSTAKKAIASQYSTSWYGETSFFAGKDLTVNGVNTWCTLTGGDNGEWEYLINRKNGTLCKSGVKVCGSANCLILLPDDWKWGENGVGDNWQDGGYPETSTEGKVTWKTMEAAGAVCLPAAGYRYGYDGDTYVYDVGNLGYYWSSTPLDFYDACGLYFDSGDVGPAHSNGRSNAYAVRLVTEVK